MSNRTTRDTRVSPGAATLWASALIIVALILTQASKLAGPSAAHAGMVSEIGDLVVLTASAGNNEDVLVILDGRSEKILIYGVNGQRQLEYRSNYEVGDLFVQGRQSVGKRNR
jgi:hypothetical protein